MIGWDGASNDVGYVQYVFKGNFPYFYLFRSPLLSQIRQRKCVLEITCNMPTTQAMAGSITDFFLRCGLTVQDQHDCFTFAAQRYPDASITLAPCQGYCSLTLFIDGDKVVQFRPQCYRLDLRNSKEAREIHGCLAPDTKFLATLPNSGLLAYSMDRIDGVTLRDFRDASGGTAVPREILVRLCMDFALFLSKAWNKNTQTQFGLGIVGKSIIPRLKSLCVNLPARFRPTAWRVLSQIHQVEALPWILTHGDITSGNIMISPSSGNILGLVDWAEAEHLPFGVGLYGLEEVLGEMTSTGFKYHRDASDLRRIFWDALRKEIPALHSSHVFKSVQLARDLGVLLWHGIAFDNGAIDRVVEDGKDLEEIYRLDAFLDIKETQSVCRLSKI